ncbi:1089_t:CDS:2 [Diversispora eburnea]|uniref:1089_t:CDS:1 n=1 Tax=Diversispora eburnea TaxID=1213867 RepID=A0A9N9B205_9GLOM|nr:1089_t:CDS:2 [Diversispora eburnea]
MNQFFAPSKFIITLDKSAKNIVSPTWNDGNNSKFELDMPERLILMANHQGMQFFKFIFLKRNWDADRNVLTKTMDRLADSKEPLWLLIFPEGTVVSKSARNKSKSYSEKNGLRDLEHLLLPRSTGLHFCTKALRKSVDYIYDLTIGFEGISVGQFPEDIYTLRGMYILGKYPRSVHIHIRKFLISEIPEEEEKFTEWLRQRWVEKDALMSEFYAKGKFPSFESSSPPKVVPLKLNSIFELANMWYFMIMFVWMFYNVPYFSNILFDKFSKFSLNMM